MNDREEFVNESASSKEGKDVYRICSQICPGVFEITQLLSHKDGLISENAGEFLLLQKICQISNQKRFSTQDKLVKNKCLHQFQVRSRFVIFPS